MWYVRHAAIFNLGIQIEILIGMIRGECPTSNSISDCIFNSIVEPKAFCLGPLLMHNTLLEFFYGFLPRWVFFEPCLHVLPAPLPSNHSYHPLPLNCSHFISPLFYTFLYFLASFLHPPLLPIVSQTLPPYPHFLIFVQFMVILLLPSPYPTIWYPITCFPTSQPLDSPSQPLASGFPP